jgi:hypothetical protein
MDDIAARLDEQISAIHEAMSVLAPKRQPQLSPFCPQFLRTFMKRIGLQERGRLTGTLLPRIKSIACKGGLISSSRSGGTLNGLIFLSL